MLHRKKTGFVTDAGEFAIVVNACKSKYHSLHFDFFFVKKDCVCFRAQFVNFKRKCFFSFPERNKVRSRLGFLEKMVPALMPLKPPKNAKRQLKLNDSSEGYNEENPAARKRTKPILKKKEKSQLEDVKLPQGSESITVFGIDLPSENAGRVLQFLEFCSKFGKVSSIYFCFFF